MVHDIKAAAQARRWKKHFSLPVGRQHRMAACAGRHEGREGERRPHGDRRNAGLSNGCGKPLRNVTQGDISFTLKEKEVEQ